MAFGRNTMSIHNCLSPCLPQQVALTIRSCFGDVHCSKKTPGEPQLCFFWRMAHVATLSSPCLILISLLYHKMLHHIFPPLTTHVLPLYPLLEQHRNDPGCFHNSLLASRFLHCSSAVLLRDLQRYESMKTFKTSYEISDVLDIIFQKYMYTYTNKYM